MKTTGNYHTLLIEDHPMYREGIVSILNGHDNIQITGQASTGEEALEMIDNSSFDLIISDLSLPGIDGLDLISKIRDKQPEVKIMILSMRCGKELVKDLISLQIDGYILKRSGKEELFKALDHIIEDKSFYDDEVTQYMMEIFNSSNSKKDSSLLSSREQDVLKLIGLQFSNKEIADQLCVSISTVESHRRNMFRKTNSKCVIGLIRYAVQNDLIVW